MNQLLKNAIADAKSVRDAAIATAKANLLEQFQGTMNSIVSKKLSESGELDDDLDGLSKFYDEDATVKEITGDDDGYGLEEGDEMIDVTVPEEEDDSIVSYDPTDSQSLTSDDNEEAFAVDGDEFSMDTDPEGNTSDAAALDGDEEFDLSDLEGLDSDEPTSPEVSAEVPAEAPVEAPATEPVAEPVPVEAPAPVDTPPVDAPVTAPVEAPVADPDLDLTGLDLDSDGDTGEADGEDDLEESRDPQLDSILSGISRYTSKSSLSESAKISKLVKALKAKDVELKQAYQAIEIIKEQINESNLITTKLTYTNKLFNTYNLTDAQKKSIMRRLDEAENVREVKLLYKTLSESYTAKSDTKKPVRTLTESYASKAVGSTKPSQIITEGDELSRRLKELAGIK
jgi:hypothetical protein